MKLLLILFGLVINLTVVGQKLTCRSLHSGKFKVTTKESGTTIIKREHGLQIEENDELKAKIIFDVTWINDCNYELRPKQVIQGDSAILSQGLVLKVRIKELKSNSYTAETTSNFSEAKIEFKVELIK